MKWRQIGQTVSSGPRDYSFDTPLISMSHDGTRVVLGPKSKWGYEKISKKAKVRVMDFDGKQWKVVQIFYGKYEDRFGWCTDLSGDGKAVAIANSEACENSGYVEVYHNTDGSGWKPKGNKLIGFGRGDRFGVSLALSEDGNQVAIGAPGGENYTGYAKVFHYDKGVLRGLLQGIVDHFIKDRCESVDWSTLVAEFTGDGWVQMGKTIAGDAEDEEFGQALSLSADGNTVAIGAPQYDENYLMSGYLKIFQYSSNQRTQETENFQSAQAMQEGGQWIQLGQELLGEDSHVECGIKLSMNAKGNIVAVGTFNDGYYVKMFHFHDKKWHSMGKIKCSRLINCISLAPNTQRIAVGNYDGDNENIMIFDFNENECVLVGDIAARNSFDNYGSSISLSSHGNLLAISYIDQFEIGSELEYNCPCVQIYQYS